MQSSASVPASPREWWWIFDPRLSLRAALALTVGGGTLLLVGLIAWIAATSLRRSIQAQVEATFETLAVQVADKIDRTIYERYRALQLAASLATLRGGSDTAPAERRRALEAIQDVSPDFAWIGLLDATGRVLVATRGQSEGAALGERSWFLLARDRPYIGNPREQGVNARDAAGSEDEPNPRVFDLAVPVAGPNGQFAGVIAAQVRWGWTRDVQASVVSDQARRDLIGVTVYGANKEVLLDSGASGWSQPPEVPAIADGRRGRGALMEETPFGTTYLTGFARSRGIREYRGLGWIAAVRQPAERAFAPVEALKRSILRWGVLLAACVFATGWVVGGRHARRLRNIGIAADRIREGDILTVLPRPRGDSEIARMCAALGEMVDHFRGSEEKAGEPQSREQAKR